jgi:hypothetical protein
MLPFSQIAYFVEDIRAAALAHHRAFGSGPFFVAEHIPLVRSEHRGIARPLDHSSAYGQWGAVMVEFVQQNNAGPSAYRDVFSEGSPGGLHHVALFVPDLDGAIGHCLERGWPLAQLAETESGIAFAFIDARAALGHMLELYEPSDMLTGFYAMVDQAARDWDGGDPLRDLD